ncbi:Alpha/beta hydrolase [Burkholderiales bacterium 8X]|nr:Alpha/beta hydrolase [Burkholderiales bacterium 8X]
MKLVANGLPIEVDDSGGADRPVILMIMGLGMQLTGWPDEMVDAFLRRGFRVVRFDNRDSGLSQGFDDVVVGNLFWQSLRHRLGLQIRTAYSLQDMALDALGVLDALQIEQAHVIGASMGGMIAQRVAASAPARVRSLVSIMSSSGAAGLPGPRPKVAAALLKQPADKSEAGLVAHGLKFVRLIASPSYPQEDPLVAARILGYLQRAYRPSGTLRQMLAVAADKDRAALLEKVRSPTLVLHGDADPLVPVECGRNTAKRIAGARFVGIPGMGHDLPPPVVEMLLECIFPFIDSVENMNEH